MATRMNFGAGSVQPDGWVNVDKNGGPDGWFWNSERGWLNIDVDAEVAGPKLWEPGSFQNDIREGLGWPTETFDYIVANHSLSDLTFHELPGALKELHRVLKPGGVLRVLVPDLMGAFVARNNEDDAWFPQGDDLTELDERFCTFVTWFGTVGSVFTQPYLRLLLVRAGFGPRGRYRPGWSPHGPEGISELDGDRTTSLIMEGIKK